MIFYTTEIEEIINYKFNDKELLRQCFTHASYANEHKNYKDNERLEFLGDSVLGLIVSEHLYKHTKENEGLMTEDKQKYVSKQPLALATRRLGIERFLMVGGEHKNATVTTDSLCENLFEAVVAGIYLDGGYENAKLFTQRNLLSLSLKSKNIINNKVNSKNLLQEYCDKHKLGKIEYNLLKKEGTEHEPYFTVELLINSNSIAKGKGKSKKTAESYAAEIALKKITKQEI